MNKEQNSNRPDPPESGDSNDIMALFDDISECKEPDPPESGGSNDTMVLVDEISKCKEIVFLFNNKNMKYTPRLWKPCSQKLSFFHQRKHR